MQFLPFNLLEVQGSIAVNFFAVLSALALASVALRFAWLAIQPLVQGGGRPSPREYVFFHTQLGYYAACLLVSNIFNVSSGLIGLRWLVQNGILEGSTTCSAQAILMQISNFATAFFTVMLAVHTALTLVFRKRQSTPASAAIIVFGWTLAVGVALVPLALSHPNGPLYGSEGISCGVRRVYVKSQFFFHLFPIFLASILSAALYSLIFLVLRGTLVIRGGLKINLDPHVRWNGRIASGEEYHRFMASVARSMLWYPIAYIALLVPYSVARLLDLSGFSVPFSVTVVAYVFWFLLGLVNVLLLYNTFRVLGPAFDACSTMSTRKDMESDGGYDRASKISPYMTQQTPAADASSRSSLNEKITQYRYPNTQSQPQSHSLAHQRSYSSTISSSSVRNLLPSHHAHSGSTGSFLTVQTQMTAASLQQAISPISQREEDLLTTPERAVQKFPSRVQAAFDHARQGSTDSLGLPAAPRRTRSPISRRPTLDSIVSSPTQEVNGTWSNAKFQNNGSLTPISDRQWPTEQLSRNSSASSYSNPRSYYGNTPSPTEAGSSTPNVRRLPSITGRATPSPSRGGPMSRQLSNSTGESLRNPAVMRPVYSDNEHARKTSTSATHHYQL